MEVDDERRGARIDARGDVLLVGPIEAFDRSAMSTWVLRGDANVSPAARSHPALRVAWTGSDGVPGWEVPDREVPDREVPDGEVPGRASVDGGDDALVEAHPTASAMSSAAGRQMGTGNTSFASAVVNSVNLASIGPR